MTRDRILYVLAAVLLAGCDGGGGGAAGPAAMPRAAPPEEVAEVGTGAGDRAAPAEAAPAQGAKKPGRGPKKPKRGKAPAAPKAPAAAAVAALPASLPASPARKAEGAEAKGSWAAAAWANPVEVTLSTEGGNGVLRLKGKGGKSDKAALASQMRLALAEKGEAALWIYNPGRRSVKVAFAVFTTADRVYYESLPIEVGRGWKKATWDLAASKYKCASSKWQNDAKIWKPDDVREVILLVYEKDGFEIAVDGISFALGEKKPEAPERPAGRGPRRRRDGPRPQKGEDTEDSEDAPAGIRVDAAPGLGPKQAKRLKAKLSDEQKAKIRETLKELEAD